MDKDWLNEFFEKSRAAVKPLTDQAADEAARKERELGGVRYRVDPSVPPTEVAFEVDGQELMRLVNLQPPHQRRYGVTWSKSWVHNDLQPDLIGPSGSTSASIVTRDVFDLAKKIIASRKNPFYTRDDKGNVWLVNILSAWSEA